MGVVTLPLRRLKNGKYYKVLKGKQDGNIIINKFYSAVIN